MVSAAAVQANPAKRRSSVEAIDRMMVQLAPQSAKASKAIRKAYRAHLDLLVLDRFDQLEGALANGGLAPLPADPLQFNLEPRLSGPSPIGEKDLDNQVSYIAARPATIGALLEIASRVKSGPLEITSLVRHTEYQGALRATNVNAATSVPMHTMGLAFDISLVNTPLPTVYEIRDVLLKMRNAGDILFIGERRQLVFHVVPAPSRLGHFTEVYERFVGASHGAAGAHVVAFSPVRDRKKGTPSVTAEIVRVLPAVDDLLPAAPDHSEADMTVEVTPAAGTVPARTAESRGALSSAAAAGGFLTALAALVAFVWPMVTDRPAVYRLFAGSPRLEGQNAAS